VTLPRWHSTIWVLTCVPPAWALQYDEYDNALNVMITHSPIAWEHVKFKDVAVKVKSQEALYKGISFYLEEHPDLLNDLLKVGQGKQGPGSLGCISCA